jgi:uncharacterized protein
MVSLLCERAANVQMRFGPTNSLDEAVLRCDVKAVRALIQHGADVNVVGDDMHPPAVLQAAVSGRCDLVQQLLDAGAILDTELQQETVVKCCSMLPDAVAAKVVKLLLPHCSSFADIDCESGATFGATLLVAAVCKGKLQVAQTLHAAGADVHYTDEDGSLMHYAASSGSLAVVEWVQSLGFDARAASAEQLLPLHCASKHKHVHIAKYLLALPGAARDVHARNDEGQTPLHAAACSGADSVVQLLLQRGADADARDYTGHSLLMLASTVAVVKLLLAAGADASAITLMNSNVLHLHAQRGSCAGIICLLLKAGANPASARSVDGTIVTAASIAGINGHFALEALLSRAAADYCKKHPIVSSAVGDSSSTSSSESSSSGVDTGTDHSDSAHGGAVSSTSDKGAVLTASATTGSSDSAAAVDAAFAALATIAAGLSIHNCDSPVSVEIQHQQQQQQQQQRCKARKAKQPCANCSKPTTKLCRQCAAVYYCSVECQKVCFADAQHRAQCEAIAAEAT